MRYLFSILALLCLSSGAVALEEKSPVSIKEWQVPWETGRPRDPYVAPDNSVWFVGQSNSYLGRFDPKAKKFTRHLLKDHAGPHNLIVGSDGIVWYAGNRKGYIGRYDPKTQKTTKIKMPTNHADDPHTLVFDANEQHIWFTVQWGNFVGRLNTSDQSVTLIPIPTSGARPYGIIIAPDGTPWVALLGTNKLASVNPRTLKLQEHILPDEDTAPRRLVATSKGQIYYVDYARGFLGHLNPKTGKIREWAAPSRSSSGPYAMAIDASDRIWFVETGDNPNHMIGFSISKQTFVSTTKIPSGAGSVRHMYYHKNSNSIWFGTDNNTIGQASLTSN